MNRLKEALRTKDRPLLGGSVTHYDPVFVEMLARVGLDMLWIEMEHSTLSFVQAEDLCRLAQGTGLIVMIRIPEARRENILHAAECGPDIINLPMVNSPELAQELVRHARYSPQGQRGFFGEARASRYGLFEDWGEVRAGVNRSLTLMAQIETREAVERAEEICAVEGLDAIMIGPGDLSDSLGVPGEMDHPQVRQAAAQAIAAAEAHDKQVAVACAPADVPYYAGQGVDLLFCCADVICYRIGIEECLRQARSQPGG